MPARARCRMRGWPVSTTSDVVEPGRQHACVDLKLSPLGAYTVLGLPLRELAGRVIGLEDLFGAAGRALAERVREAPDWDGRFDLIEVFLARRAAASPAPRPAAAYAWARLSATDGRLAVGQLAAELGCSRRYLAATFNEQVGLPPKTVARLLRFQAVRRRLVRARPPGGDRRRLRLLRPVSFGPRLSRPGRHHPERLPRPSGSRRAGRRRLA